VLIDTAGRYTTQDSDAGRRPASWLGVPRPAADQPPRQPINGVLVAISHRGHAPPASAGRDRGACRRDPQAPAELHEELKVDFPVYVVFTKADLIAGFTEYFGDSRRGARRRSGARRSRPPTARQHGRPGRAELDLLIERLNERLPDRLQEGAGPSRPRGQMFGFPAQLAALPRRSSIFSTASSSRRATTPMRRCGASTSPPARSRARPIDQVIGALAKLRRGERAAQRTPASARATSCTT
jgi:type VI secretion system protein ImpL